MSVQHFPHEVLQNIMKVFDMRYDRRTVINCASVCQSWHLPACQVLYKKISISGSRRTVLKCLALQKTDLGAFCKTLVITKDHFKKEIEEPYTSEEFAQLLSYLPHLTAIELDGYEHRMHYLELIKENAGLLGKVEEIIADGEWSPKEQPLYNACVYALKDTIQKMQLISLHSTLKTPDGRAGGILQFLDEFKAVYNLEVVNSGDKGASCIPHLSIFPLMRSCPNLITFKIVNDFLEPREDDGVRYFDHSKVKYLDITVPDITPKQIDYIASNITRLKELKIRGGFRRTIFSRSRPRDWIVDISADHLRRFQNYIASIEHVDLSLGDNYKPNIEDYWPFIKGCISHNQQDVSTPLHLSILMDRVPEFLPEWEILLRKRQDSAFLHYALNVNKFFESAESKVPTAKAFVPFKYEELDIQSVTIYLRLNLQVTMMKMLSCTELIESVMNSFLNLHHFNLRIGSYGDRLLQITVGSEELKYEKANHIVSKLERSLPIAPSNSEKKLKYVLLQGAVWTHTIKFIVRSLPNTEYLKLYDYLLQLDGHYNMELNLQHLRLQQLVFDIGPVLDGENAKQVVVLQIMETMTGETIYYKWQRETHEYQTVDFQPVEADVLEREDGFSTKHATYLIIKCHNVEELKISLDDTYVVTTLDVASRRQ